MPAPLAACLSSCGVYGLCGVAVRLAGLACAQDIGGECVWTGIIFSFWYRKILWCDLMIDCFAVQLSTTIRLRYTL